MNLKLIAQDPAEFRRVLVIDGANGKPVRLADALDSWQAEDFAALDPAWRSVAGQDVPDAPRRAFLERPRGHSKTADLAVMVVWALAFSQRQLNGVAAAADRDQARLLRDAISRLVHANPWLADVLDVQQYRIVNLRTGSTLEILSSDAATSFGIAPDFVAVDELTHWKSRELWDSLLSSAAKRANCLLVVISNAGFKDSWQWTTREAVRNDPDWLFRRLEGPVASWITLKALAEQQRLLPGIAYNRLWLNEWTAGSGDAIAPADLAAAFVMPGPLTAPEPGGVYIAGLDLGLSRDASALVMVGKDVGWTERRSNGVTVYSSSMLAAMADAGLIPPAEEEVAVEYHPGTGVLQVVSVDVWRPQRGIKVEVEEIERRILALYHAFGLGCVAYDPWQAEYLAERLSRRGVNMFPVPFTSNNLQTMATEVVGHFRDGKVRAPKILERGELRRDLASLRIVDRPTGCRLDSPRTLDGHGDSAVAFALATVAAKEIRSGIPPRLCRKLLVGVGDQLID